MNCCKPLVLFFLLAMAVSVNAQFTDDFSDGDFTTGTVWTGDVSEYQVTAGELQSNGPAATSELSLVTANSMINNTEWRFKVKLTFNPSTSNYMKVYLVSDQADLEMNLNGYYILFGETGSGDSVQFYRQDGGIDVLLFSGSTPCMPSSSTNTVSVKVTRDGAGMWSIFTDCTGGTAYLLDGTLTDNTHTSTTHFGVWSRYSTVSRANMFYYDDFYVGNIIVDATPPSIDSLYVSGVDSLSLKFDEAVDPIIAGNASNYSVDNGLGTPASVTVDGSDASLVHLKFAANFQSGINYAITASNIQDLFGNTATTLTDNFYLLNPYEVLINEVLPDPDSTLSAMPNAEFVELYNTTSQPINIGGWGLSDATKIASSSPSVIPPYTLAPNGYVILTKTTTVGKFVSYGDVLGLTSYPSLNNSEEELLLTDNLGRPIHYVNYTDNWYQDPLKENGGFTLELIDPNNPCQGQENWRASVSVDGGTPGAVNSVFAANADSTFPDLLRAVYIDPNTIELVFSEPLLQANATNETNYSVDNGLGNPLVAEPLAHSFNTVRLTFTMPIGVGTVYTVTVNSISDCAGNAVTMMNTAKFGVPQTANAKDIIINEVLFNPLSGDNADFVELYNKSDKIIDLFGMLVFEYDIDDTTNLTDMGTFGEHFLLFPNEFVVLTENPSSITDNYITENPSQVVEMSSLPNFADNGGVIQLILGSASLDKLAFYDDWHFELIDDEDGVSLERIDYTTKTQDQNNWHSAASTVDYATPTYQNSQFANNLFESNNITVSPEVFTPNQDGINDFTSINYEFDENGLVGSVSIYDVKGRLIKELAQNQLLDASGSFNWDGLDTDNQKARIGIYIVLFEVFNTNGDTNKYKQKVVLGSSF